MIGSGASPTIEAGGLQLTNSSGSSATAAAGDNTLQITASAAGSDAGTGQVLVGPGRIAISGASKVSVRRCP